MLFSSLKCWYPYWIKHFEFHNFDYEFAASNLKNSLLENLWNEKNWKHILKKKNFGKKCWKKIFQNNNIEKKIFENNNIKNKNL